MNAYKTNVQENALVGIANGVNRAANVVRKTMGPKGMNVALEMEDFPFFGVTNDGATIIDKLQFDDPCEKIGLNAIKEAVARSNSNSGDGSTTTCVLLDAILQEAVKTGANGVQLKNELDALLPIIEKSIDDQKKTISVQGVESVATIAGESQEMGKLLGEIYGKIGKDGIVHLEGSGTYSTSYDFINGIRFKDAGYLSPYMVHDEQALKENQKETKAIYENPTILVTKQKISHLNDINPLLETLSSQNKKDLVIFTDDMDSGVASIMVQAHKSKVFNILVIKAPVLYKNSVFEDFAKCTGSTIVEDSSGINLKNLPLSALGTCGKIITDKEETVLIGIKDISDHIQDLQKREDTESKLRLSWLTNKTALLKLGALSETDLFYKRLKCEDAIYSSRTALNDGIVAGGGIALLNVANSLVDVSGGSKILKEALKAPIQQIIINAGNPKLKEWFDGSEPHALEVFSTLSGMVTSSESGFDAKNGKLVNMFDAGIVDSALIVKNAVKNAIGIASTLLTTSSIITKPPESPEEIAAKVLAGRGMRF